MEKHTPGPWRVVRPMLHNHNWAIDAGPESPSASDHIATVWRSFPGLHGPNEATSEANAAYIVHACNNYLDLLEALTIMASWAEREHWDVRATDALGLAYHQARAVIARCGGAS